VTPLLATSCEDEHAALRAAPARGLLHRIVSLNISRWRLTKPATRHASEVLQPKSLQRDVMGRLNGDRDERAQRLDQPARAAAGRKRGTTTSIVGKLHLLLVCLMPVAVSAQYWCEAGKFTAATGSTVCTDCEPGKYKATAGPQLGGPAYNALSDTCRHCARDAFVYKSGQNITVGCWECACGDGSQICGCLGCPAISPLELINAETTQLIGGGRGCGDGRSRPCPVSMSSDAGYPVSLGVDGLTDTFLC
jgi:hypothetical protein